MRQIKKFETREEWLNFRKEGIGGSEVGTIMGVNSFQTLYQLWQIKKGILPPIEENEAMLRGHQLENSVATIFADTTGFEIIEDTVGDYIVFDDERPYLRVSPDREFFFADGTKGVLECKTTRRDVSEDDIPLSWYCQLQYQLGMLGYERGAIAWLKAVGFEFGYKIFNFDKDFFDMLINKVEDFYTNYIAGDKEPDVTCVEDVVSKYPTHEAGKTLEIDSDIYNACVELKGIKEQIDALEETKKELEEKIKLAMQDNEAITFEGNTIATWKSSKSSVKFNAKKFQNDNPELAEKYMEETLGAQRFLLK